MIAANEEVGRRLLEAETEVPPPAPALHEPPSASVAVATCLALASGLGLRKPTGAPTPGKLNKMMYRKGSDPLKPVLSQVLLRPEQSAV